MSDSPSSRERILRAATALFAARGFAPVTMRAIGAEAGLDNSSLYRHFPSKSELARAVLDEAAATLLEELRPTLPAGTETVDALVDAIEAVAAGLWDRPETARLLVHWVMSPRDAATGFDVSLPADTLEAPSGALFRSFTEALARARERGTARDAAWPDTFVTALGALLLRPATRGSLLASHEPARSEEEARRAWLREVRTLARGLLTPP